MPKEYQIILNYSFISKPTSSHDALSFHIEIALFLLFTLPSILVTLAEMFKIGSVFTERLLVMLNYGLDVPIPFESYKCLLRLMGTA